MSRTLEARTDQWGRHVYTDDLPPCPLAPSGEVFEAIGVTSQIKALKGDFADYAAKTVATWAVEHRAVWEPLKVDQAVTLIAAERKRALDAAADRGVDLHNAVESYANGATSLSVVDPNAAAYLPAVERFVEECRPEFIWSEVAVCNRAVGYAGKNDSVIRLRARPELGVRFADWKSRAKAAVYDTEAPQLAAYSHAEYGVLDGARVPLPAHDGGLVVVFTPTGYEMFPVDLEMAWPVFLAAAGLYRIKGDARRAVGAPLVRPELPVVVEPPTVPVVGAGERRAWLRARIDTLKTHHPAAVADLARRWPHEIPTLVQSETHTDAQLDVVATLLAAVEADHEVPFGPPDPTTPTPTPILTDTAPARSNVVDLFGDGPKAPAAAPAETVAAIKARLDALPADLAASVEATAIAGGVPNFGTGRATATHAAVVDAELTVAERVHEERKGTIASLLAGLDDELVAALAVAASGGMALDRFEAPDVERLELLCDALAVGALGLVYDPGARLAPTPAAEVALMKQHGTKTALLVAAKGAADRLDRPKPRSAAAVTADPVLVAAALPRPAAVGA